MPTQMTSSSDLGVVGDTVRPAVGMRVVSAALLHACVRSTLDAACSGPHLWLLPPALVNAQEMHRGFKPRGAGTIVEADEVMQAKYPLV
jgi:hypothetical protein